MAIELKSYRSRLMERLTIPSEAEHYINAAWEDSIEMFFEAVKDVAQAHQVSTVAKKSGVAREGLYRSFSKGGNPSWRTVLSVLNVVGLEIPGVRVRAAVNSSPVSGRTSSRRARSVGSGSRKGVGSYYASATSAQLTLAFPIESANVVKAGKEIRLSQPSASAKFNPFNWILPIQQSHESNSLVFNAMLATRVTDAANEANGGGWV
jgi:probable addiction module antidote protein